MARIRTVSIPVTTTGADGSATGTAVSDTLHGFLVDVFVDWHADAPATSDLTLLYESPANGQILAVSNSATDDFFAPRQLLSDSAGADITGGYDLYALNGTVRVNVAQSNALAPAVTLRLRYVQA